MTDTSGVTSYGYDTLDRLTHVQYAVGDCLDNAYDLVGNRISLTKTPKVTLPCDGAPSATTYTYDQVDQIKTINGTGNNFDKNGNLYTTGTTNPAAADNFLYDNENRLFKTGACSADVNADSAVNSTDLAQVSTHYASEGSANYDLLADVNMDGVINSTDLGITSAEFGRNCKSTGANDGTERNWFSGDGLRVRARTHLTSPNRIDDDYVWDQGASLPQILQDVRMPNTGSASTTTYLYGLGLISETSSATSATSFYLSDGLGSTTELRDSSGAALNSYTYDVWGAIRTSTGSTANQFDFTGQQTDHNANRGLQYLRARFYDPSLGRFLGRDPLPFVQRYAYAGGSPTNATDPTGLCCSIGGYGIHIPLPPIPTRNAQFLLEWVTGTGSSNRHYGQNDPETIDMRNSMGAQQVRDQFVAQGCSDISNGAYSTPSAYVDTLLNPFTADPFATSAQVGGFARASVRNSGDGTISITIPNDAGSHSFFLHALPNSPFSHGPLRTISQTFEWTEGLPAGCTLTEREIS